MTGGSPDGAHPFFQDYLLASTRASPIVGQFEWSRVVSGAYSMTAPSSDIRFLKLDFFQPLSGGQYPT